MEESSKLIEKRERVDEEDYSSNSPLHAAIQEKRRDTVQVLLSQPDTDVNHRTPDGCTGLWLACDPLAGDLTIARDLLDHGADPNIPNNGGFSPLHAACNGGNLELVQLLIHHQAQVNSQDADGLTPLHCSAATNSPEVAECLLAHNADLTLRKTDGSSALHTACRMGAMQLVEVLVRHQANINSQDGIGCTPLHCAVASRATEIVKYLLAHKANANIRESQGLNVLLFAMKHGYSCVDVLVSRTHDLDAVTPDGWTAVLFAASFRLSTLRKLLARGASLTAHTCDESPLLLALLSRGYARFALVWQHTDPDTVSATADFMRLVCIYCKLPRCYKYYELIFNTPGIDLHVAGEPGFFYNLFNNRPRIANYYTAKSQYLDVFRWLLDRGAQLDQSDVEQILWHFAECTYSAEMWRLVFAKTTPHVFDDMVRGAVYYKNYDLARMCIPYCLHLNSEAMVNIRYEIEEPFLRFCLTLFTPTKRHRQAISAWPQVASSASAKKMLKDTPRVKSLVEVTRDAIRQAMRVSCSTSAEFFAALEKLEIPSDLKDVIRLRVPVNAHLLAD